MYQSPKVLSNEEEKNNKYLSSNSEFVSDFHFICFNCYKTNVKSDLKPGGTM